MDRHSSAWTGTDSWKSIECIQHFLGFPAKGLSQGLSKSCLIIKTRSDELLCEVVTLSSKPHCFLLPQNYCSASSNTILRFELKFISSPSRRYLYSFLTPVALRSCSIQLAFGMYGFTSFFYRDCFVFPNSVDMQVIYDCPSSHPHDSIISEYLLIFERLILHVELFWFCSKGKSYLL